MTSPLVLNEHSFLVNEIYSCLQGEGVNLGLPAILVRLQICNLRCTWCDTPYTHTFTSDPSASATDSITFEDLNPAHVVASLDAKKGTPQRFVRMGLGQLIEHIGKLAPIKHLILSGGEPTLQNLAALMHGLDASYSAEVETNGTRIPHLQLAGFSSSDYSRFQWNISPKGANAGQALALEALRHWADLAIIQDNVFFKFVIRKNEAQVDLKEVLTLQETLGLSAARIFLMPEGTTVESQVANTWLHDICLQHGFRYSPRLHVLLFGARRGV